MSRGGNGGSRFWDTVFVVGLAFGVGVLGAKVLDHHGHTCVRCGHRWAHLGAFNVGDEKAHACPGCGTIQWWKDGAFAHAHTTTKG